ncbi:12042_t:CDS:2, partial [Funneliformis geosporum]
VNVRNSVVHVDEEGNALSPEEAENIRNSVVYVDEEGNELSPEEAENIRNSVVYLLELRNSLKKIVNSCNNLYLHYFVWVSTRVSRNT